MTGAEFTAEGHRLALAYTRLRPGGAAWLAAWLSEDRAAATELMEWELEGHPFADLPIKIGAETMTVADALAAMLTLYAAPGTWTREGIARDAAGRQVTADSPDAVAWSLEGALERVVGDWEEDAQRQELLAAVCDACGADLAALNDTVSHQRVVVGVLSMGREAAVAFAHQSTPT